MWICHECGGSHKATIEEHLENKDTCPYCENKKVLPGFNDLKTTHPHVAKEWGIENYILGIGGPENYKSDSTKRVYWKCSKCGTRYKMPIDDRVIKDKRGHEPCWKCAGRMKNILKL